MKITSSILLLLVCIYSLNGKKSTSRCSKGCPFIYEPRCASNGQTYDNECLMTIAQCELGRSLELIRMGRCGNEENENEESLRTAKN
ncbi:PI-actitoxin-Avd5a-like [Clytia hemisphaerica]|uniref:PI-actitoxin-Avd5a-like n=1 Tax=Clytia hemisphaerica TaxID=252671 RepID=UPI0034D4F451